MARPTCLFTAPVDFDPALVKEFASVANMRYGTLSSSLPLVPDASVRYWIPDPNQPFVIDEDALSKLPCLEAIITPSTGRNHIDETACREGGIAVYSLCDRRERLQEITASSEFAFLLLLKMFRHPPRNEIKGKLVGIVGLGRIGKNVARYLHAFGARYCYYDPNVKEPEDCRVPLRRLFKISDAVLISCSLTPQTNGLITEKHLRSMRHNAILVNVSRGDVIVESDLIDVLVDRDDLRVALDVVSGEEKGMANYTPLLRAGVVCTPHVAGKTVESRTKATAIALEILTDVIQAKSRT